MKWAVIPIGPEQKIERPQLWVGMSHFWFDLEDVANIRKAGKELNASTDVAKRPPKRNPSTGFTIPMAILLTTADIAGRFDARKVSAQSNRQCLVALTSTDGLRLGPLLYDGHEFRTDSGGAGKYRGGIGVEVKVTPRADLRAYGLGPTSTPRENEDYAFMRKRYTKRIYSSKDGIRNATRVLGSTNEGFRVLKAGDLLDDRIV